MQRGGFSINSKHCVLSVNWMWSKTISSWRYWRGEGREIGNFIQSNYLITTLSLTHHFLFQGKDVVVEEFVQFLVGVVDAELLEGIHCEILESKNVEHAQEPVSKKKNSVIIGANFTRTCETRT